MGTHTQEKGAHHSKRNSFNYCKNFKLDEKMCPRTLSILKRTVGINTEIGRHRAKLNALINKVIDTLDGMER